MISIKDVTVDYKQLTGLVKERNQLLDTVIFLLSISVKYKNELLDWQLDGLGKAEELIKEIKYKNSDTEIKL